MRTGRILFAGFVIGCAGLFSCAEKERQQGVYPLRVKGIVIDVELAISPAEQQRGLKFRDDLPEGRGMLFCYPASEVRKFWMKDTYIPLSIAFVEYDGTISQIEDMKPLDERPVASDAAVKYALEVPQGFFEKNRIQEGDKIEIPEEIKALIKKRLTLQKEGCLKSKARQQIAEAAGIEKSI